MMKFTEGIPKWIGWIFKAFIYGLALIILLTLVFFYTGNGLAGNVEKCESETGIRKNTKNSTLKNTQALVACLEKENGILENWLIRDTIKTVQALPNAPCQYVGVWESVRPQCRYTMIMKENGEFTATPIVCDLSMSFYSGIWGVHENKMAWLDSKEYRWPIDINTIEAEDKNSFSLTEVNGTSSVFTRIKESSQTMGCAKPAATSPASSVAVAQPVIASESVAASAVAVVSGVTVTQIKPTEVVATAAPSRADHTTKKVRAPRRKPADMRYCLERSGNYEIAKCATEHE